MSAKLLRRIFLFTIAGALCAVLAAASAVCSCCPVPGSESSDPYADVSNSSVVAEYFEQTVGDYSSNPAGHHVRERAGSEDGSNSCWFSGSYAPQYPKPGSAEWLIQSNEEWGPDEIGLLNKDAEQIWGKYEDGAIKLPCSVVTYQEMEIECTSGRWQPYEYNIYQSRTIDSSKALKACRVSTSNCGGEISIY
ncbi:MAG: hypothetical protein ACRD2B_15020 [Terriglobia bacterium]